MLNSGPSISEDEEEEEDEEFKLTSGKDCPTARTEALEAWRNDPSIKLVIPQCTTFGTYQEVQCYDTFCWCVDINKGLPMKGSATPSNGTTGSRAQIDCSNKKDVINRVQKECPVEQKLTFLKLLIQHFEQEMIRNTRNRDGDTRNRDRDTRNRDGDTRNRDRESPGQGRISSSKETGRISKETIINWKFNKLDVNRNKVLEKDEWRKFKRQMKRNRAKSVHLGNSTRSMTYTNGQSINGQSINGQSTTGGQSSRSGRRRRGRSGFRSENSSVSESMKAVRKYRHCFKYFFKGCDIEPRDKKVTQEEWFGCTGLYMSEEDESRPPTENPRNDRRRSGSRHSPSSSPSSNPSNPSYSGPLASSFAPRPGHRNPSRESSVSSSIISSFTPGMRDEISRRRKGGRRKGPNPFSTILKAD